MTADMAFALAVGSIALTVGLRWWDRRQRRKRSRASIARMVEYLKYSLPTSQVGLGDSNDQ